MSDDLPDNLRVETGAVPDDVLEIVNHHIVRVSLGIETHAFVQKHGGEEFLVLQEGVCLSCQN